MAMAYRYGTYARTTIAFDFPAVARAIVQNSQPGHRSETFKLADGQEFPSITSEQINDIYESDHTEFLVKLIETEVAEVVKMRMDAINLNSRIFKDLAVIETAKDSFAMEANSNLLSEMSATFRQHAGQFSTIRKQLIDEVAPQIELIQQTIEKQAKEESDAWKEYHSSADRILADDKKSRIGKHEVKELNKTQSNERKLVIEDVNARKKDLNKFDKLLTEQERKLHDSIEKYKLIISEEKVRRLAEEWEQQKSVPGSNFTTPFNI